MALSNKTLTPGGTFVGAGGNSFDSAQFAEDLHDAVSALETTSSSLDSAGVARLAAIGPVAAKAADDVHALYDNTSAAFPGPFTDPDVPRNLRVTFSASWDGGDVTVTGTDQFDNVIQEVFADVAGTAVVGTKIFKTVTGATKQTPAGVAGNGASIGTGDKIGTPYELADTTALLLVGTTPEAVTVTATTGAHGFTPTTTPADTTYLLLANYAIS